MKPHVPGATDDCRQQDSSLRNPLPDDQFMELLNSHRSQLLGYLFCVVRNLADAEDLFQQVSLTLWDKLAEFEPGTNFGAWAMTIARNKALTFLRSKSRERARFSDEIVEEMAQQSLWSPDDVDQRVGALLHCQEKLPAADQALLSLCYCSEEKTRDIAEQLNRPIESIYNSLSRIRKTLYQCIQRTLAREGHL